MTKVSFWGLWLWLCRADWRWDFACERNARRELRGKDILRRGGIERWCEERLRMRIEDENESYRQFILFFCSA